jgi:diacylglycerol kinase family enzyme
MYYYIVDPQKISQREFERVQNILYSSLSEYRISGEIMRVTGLRTINQLVDNAFSHGAKTIVAVGSDDTLHDVVNAIGKREITVGFIPIFDTEIANTLGISGILQAARTIGLRRIAELDLGSVNGNYFLSKLTFGLDSAKLFNLPSFDVKFSANNEYTASLNVVGGIVSSSLVNENLDITLLSGLSKWQTFLRRRQILAGNLENLPGVSIVHAKKIEITNPSGLPIRTGSRVVAKTPLVIEIVPKALRIIVGKDRKF